jgi:hypothetical protein
MCTLYGPLKQIEDNERPKLPTPPSMPSQLALVTISLRVFEGNLILCNSDGQNNAKHTI